LQPFVLLRKISDWPTLIQFTLYSRSYCHLCDDLLDALQQFNGNYAYKVEVIDVDLDENLVAQYDELVPVLMGRKDDGDLVKLCHYFLDVAKVRAFLAGE